MKTLLKLTFIIFSLVILDSCNDDEEPPVAGDTTAPTILSISPDDGSEDVPISVEVTITFSEDLDVATVTSNTVSLRGGSSTVNGTLLVDGSSVTFIPSTDLAHSTTYTIIVDSGITDEAGNRLSQSRSSSFTTIAPPDVAPPVVVSIDPEDGETGVSLETNIVIEFSEQIDINSVSDNSVALTTPAFSNNIEAEVSINGNIMTIDPTVNFEEVAVYTLVLGTGLTDLAGNSLGEEFQSSFTTLSLDTEAPTVVSSDPEANETGVLLNANITITFSEAIDASSINDNSLLLTEFGISDLLEATVTVVDNVLTVDPATDFNEGTTYNISLPAGGIRDLVGNELASSFEVDFTTEVIDRENPSVLGFSISPDQTDVPVESSIIVNFSEPIDPATLENMGITFRELGKPDQRLGLTFNVTGNDVEVIPNEPMKGNVRYIMDVNRQRVKDLAGNILDSAYKLEFTTEMVPLTVVSTIPENNAIDVEVDQEIVITFSEPINASTVSVFWAGSGPAITTSVNENVLTVTATNGFTEFERRYLLQINSSIEDIYGNSLDGSLFLGFTTIFASEKYYYRLENYEQNRVSQPSFLAFRQASPQITYESNDGLTSRSLWRFSRIGSEFGIINKFLEDNNFNAQYLQSFDLRVDDKLAYSEFAIEGSLWELSTPTTGVRLLKSRGNILDGQNITMKDDGNTSSGFRWWNFTRSSKIPD